VNVVSVVSGNWSIVIPELAFTTEVRSPRDILEHQILPIQVVESNALEVLVQATNISHDR